MSVYEDTPWLSLHADGQAAGPAPEFPDALATFQAGGRAERRVASRTALGLARHALQGYG